jgi:hypothetical protein
MSMNDNDGAPGGYNHRSVGDGLAPGSDPLAGPGRSFIKLFDHALRTGEQGIRNNKA